MDRALHTARLRHLPVGVRARQPEVRDLHDADVGNQDVLGLDVPVHDAPLVRRLQREQRLADDIGRLRGLQPDVRVQQIAHRPPTHELHDHVIDAVDRAPVVDGDDIRM